MIKHLGGLNVYFSWNSVFSTFNIINVFLRKNLWQYILINQFKNLQKNLQSIYTKKILEKSKNIQTEKEIDNKILKKIRINVAVDNEVDGNNIT